MNGFGFIEYKDPMDARDVVPGEFSHKSMKLRQFSDMCLCAAAAFRTSTSQTSLSRLLPG